MTRPRNRRRPRDAVEQELMDALERLRHGLPQHPDHKELLRKRGRVAITVAAVAREANRSRALISHEGCRYPAVRLAVLAEAGVPGVEPGNLADVVATLRAQVAQLRVELATARDEAAQHLTTRCRAEKRLAHAEKRYQGLAERVRRGDPKGKVVPLYPEDADAEQA